MPLSPENAIRARSARAAQGTQDAPIETAMTAGASRRLGRTLAQASARALRKGSVGGQAPQHGLPDLGRLRHRAEVHVLRNVARPVVVRKRLPARYRDEVGGRVAGAVGDDRVGGGPRAEVAPKLDSGLLGPAVHAVLEVALIVLHPQRALTLQQRELR